MVIKIQENLLEQDIVGFLRWDEILNFFLDCTFDNGKTAKQFTGVLEYPCHISRLSTPTAPPHPLEK